MQVDTIRKLKTKDLPSLTQLFDYSDEKKMIRENGRYIEKGVIDIFGVYDNNNLVGELRVKYKSSDKRFTKNKIRVYLYAFRVKATHQGQGIGKLLFGEVLHRLTIDGYSEFTIGVEVDNEVALHIYDQFAFNEKIATITESYENDSYKYDLLLKRSRIIDSSSKKIMIIGSGGSGKSTLAVLLGQKLNLPVVHLDKLHWQKGWVETTQVELREKIDVALMGDRWIVDGNYHSTMDARICKSDTVIFLDMNKWRCLWRVVKRRLKYNGKTRPDMGEGCLEKADFEFLKYVYDYPKKSKPKAIALLRTYRNVKIIIIKTPKQLDEFVAKLGQ